MDTLHSIKIEIWHHRRIHQNLVDLQVFADKAGVQLPITDIHEAEKLLKSLSRKIKKKIETPVWCIQRYEQAHKDWFSGTYPNAFKDGFYPGMEPDWPDVGTSNGLTTLITNYLEWAGHFANRTGNEGRVIIVEGEAKRIKSSSKKGMQDIDTNIRHPQHPFGIPWKIEIKIGRDTHKEKQKEYGAKVSKTGGVYSVVKTAEDFFEQLDKLLILA
jgi:hypothetical protein